jgi:glucose-1-phosphate adenylyltransferase
VVVDRGCIIPDGMVIGEDAAGRRGALLPHRQGITLVTREMLRGCN